MIYKEFTIVEDHRNPYGKPEWMYYLTEDGICHDADYYNESYHYCGNCKWAASLQEAKDAIDEQIDIDFTDEFGCIDQWALGVMERRWRELELIASKQIQSA